MPRIADMKGIANHEPGYEPELRRDDKTDRLVIRVYDKARYSRNYTDLDLLELFDWFFDQEGPTLSAITRSRKGS